MELRTRYIHLSDYPYTSTRALAETLAKRWLQKEGFLVWRGSFLDVWGQGQDVSFFEFPAQARHYTDLVRRLTIGVAAHQLHDLRRQCSSRHGTPDWLAFDPASASFQFFEVKFGSEPLRPNQVETIRFIQDVVGIPVTVLRFCPRTDRRRVSSIDLGAMDDDLRDIGRKKRSVYERLVSYDLPLRKALRVYRKLHPLRVRKVKRTGHLR
ncbi:MAG: VRR-NUC domain-containing protein [Nanoarchaeota archaeon]